MDLVGNPVLSASLAVSLPVSSSQRTCTRSVHQTAVANVGANLIFVFNLTNYLILWDRGSPRTSGWSGTCYVD